LGTEQAWDVIEVIYSDGTSGFWEDGLHLTGARVHLIIFVLLRDQWTFDLLPDGFAVCCAREFATSGNLDTCRMVHRGHDLPRGYFQVFTDINCDSFLLAFPIFGLHQRLVAKTSGFPARFQCASASMEETALCLGKFLFL